MTEPLPRLHHAPAQARGARRALRRDVLRQAGLPPGLFDQEKILVSTEELFALYRGLAEASRDPAIGLKLGTEHRVERYDPIAIAAVSARSLRDALQRLARYKQLTCPEELEVAERGEECRVQFRWLLAEETEPALLVDVCFAAVVAHRPPRDRRARHPEAARASRSRRGNREMYEAHFGCPAKFDARGTRSSSQGGPRSALPHAQRGPFRGGRAAARGRAGAGARFEGDRRAGQGHPEAAAGRAAAGDRGRRERAAPELTDAATEAGRRRARRSSS